MRYAEANTVYGVNKARLIKRVAAIFLDFVIFALIAVGIATLFSSILNYDSYREKLDAKYEYYGVYAQIDPTKPAEEQTGMMFCEVKDKEMHVLWLGILFIKMKKQQHYFIHAQILHYLQLQLEC